jgi:hypothetical protein
MFSPSAQGTSEMRNARLKESEGVKNRRRVAGTGLYRILWEKEVDDSVGNDEEQAQHPRIELTGLDVEGEKNDQRGEKETLQGSDHGKSLFIREKGVETGFAEARDLGFAPSSCGHFGDGGEEAATAPTTGVLVFPFFL